MLTSIRKILNDGEARPPADDVLMLDESMLVRPQPAATDAPQMPGTPLIAPAAAAAATHSVETLMRTLLTEQSMRMSNQGPTIEDIVRDEIRPLLKNWLDEHLPPLVERLVRLEIERVVGRVRT